jgi:hypothetical protein
MRVACACRFGVQFQVWIVLSEFCALLYFQLLQMPLAPRTGKVQRTSNDL